MVANGVNFGIRQIGNVNDAPFNVGDGGNYFLQQVDITNF
jgi:hypothetical protein